MSSYVEATKLILIILTFSGTPAPMARGALLGETAAGNPGGKTEKTMSAVEARSGREFVPGGAGGVMLFVQGGVGGTRMILFTKDKETLCFRSWLLDGCWMVRSGVTYDHGCWMAVTEGLFFIASW